MVLSEVKCARTSTAPITPPRERIFATALAFAAPLVFAIITRHVWEDYYITFRASKNLALGNGLVYQIGERVHSFTSPLGVLLPAFLYLLTHSDTLALWCFRLIACGALAGSIYLIWGLLEERGCSRVGCWLSTVAV